MTETWWDALRFLLIPALVALVAWFGTRYAARLAATRKQVDLLIETLDTFGDDLMTAATEAQRYVMFTERELQEKVQPPETIRATLEAVEPLILASQSVRFRALGLPFPRVRRAYDDVDDLLRRMVNDSDGRIAVDIWNEAMDDAEHDRDVISLAIKATAEQRMRLLTMRPTNRYRPETVGACWSCRTGRWFPEPK